MKRITVAKTAGFCFGVRRAVDAAFAEARSGRRLHARGAHPQPPDRGGTRARACGD
ncbi:MAG: hypothetical protein ACLVL7_08050 [Anaerotruncus massiliensis (ex Togo et al. 2019)]